jgi:hypothetical protein
MHDAMQQQFGQDKMNLKHNSFLPRIGYFFLLIVLSGYVLAIFLKPSDIHAGINHYYRSKFLDMVEGSAYKPFVYRTLLPTAIRVVTSLTPAGVRETFSAFVEQDSFLRKIFYIHEWETSAAYQYFVVSFLMLLCFLGFAHFTTKMTIKFCEISDTTYTRSLLSTLVLMALPQFFTHTSFLYDPPQLLLFTLALYFTGSLKLRAFVISFVLCCINKETAVLLIPIYALSFRGHCSTRRYYGVLLLLICCYAFIKSSLWYAFYSNPGTIVEFHFFDHNIKLLSAGLKFTSAPIGFVLLALSLYRWNNLPYFYRVSFLCTLPPLAILALFFGFLDEWRGYYEVYPIAFGIVLHLLLRARVAFAPKVVSRRAGVPNREPTA